MPKSTTTQVQELRKCINCGKLLTSRSKSGFCGRRECQNARKQEQYERDKALGVCTYSGCKNELAKGSIMFCFQHRQKQRKPPPLVVKHCLNCDAPLSPRNKSEFCSRKKCRYALNRLRYKDAKEHKMCTYFNCKEPVAEGMTTLCSWHRDVQNANKRKTAFEERDCRNCGEKLGYHNKSGLCSRRECRNLAENERHRLAKVAKGTCAAPRCDQPLAEDSPIFCLKHWNRYLTMTQGKDTPLTVSALFWFG